MSDDQYGMFALPTLLRPEKDASWRDHAACRREGNIKFFDGKNRQDAILICAACTVSSSCLKFALDNQVKDGVWGGRFFGRSRQ